MSGNRPFCDMMHPMPDPQTKQALEKIVIEHCVTTGTVLDLYAILGSVDVVRRLVEATCPYGIHPLHIADVFKRMGLVKKQENATTLPYKDWIDGDRQTGRTQEMLEDVVRHIFENQPKLVIITGHRIAFCIDHLRPRLARMLHGLVPDLTFISPCLLRSKACNLNIIFKRHDANLDEYSNCTIFHDHYYGDRPYASQ